MLFVCSILFLFAKRSKKIFCKK